MPLRRTVGMLPVPTGGVVPSGSARNDVVNTDGNPLPRTVDNQPVVTDTIEGSSRSDVLIVPENYIRGRLTPENIPETHESNNEVRDSGLTVASIDASLDDLDERIDEIESSIIEKTVNLQQIAGNYTIFTGTGNDVLLESLTIRLPNVNVADDVNITGISIQTNNTTPTTYIPQAMALKASLTAESEFSWYGASIINTGVLIRLTIYGGASDASTLCKVVAKYKPLTGGSLA